MSPSKTASPTLFTRRRKPALLANGKPFYPAICAGPEASGVALNDQRGIGPVSGGNRRCPRYVRSVLSSYPARPLSLHEPHAFVRQVMPCKVASPRHTIAQLVDSFLARAEPEDFENRWYAVRAFRI